ncbi:helix-turn-helix domain-containing protein [uncultured Tateyamaria sp.]|uniref:helix-turn-helix domain-containing protein n=1 Tax=uncultured Tateyamaria sp. TaxID=455651 RepID=UPI00345035A7
MAIDLDRHAQIRIELLKLGVSFSDVASRAERSRSGATGCSQGRFFSHAIQAELAKSLGTTPQALFPERYDEEGNPLKHRS